MTEPVTEPVVDPAAAEIAAEIAQMSDQQVFHALWRRGDLRYKLDPHQLEVEDLFNKWDIFRRTEDYEKLVEKVGATLDSVWVEEIGRRWGKTSRWIIKLTMIGLTLPEITGEPVMLTYATAAQKSIGSIIVPLANALLRDGPDDLRPKYYGTRGALHEGLYFPGDRGVIKLVGVDEHPDALRGQYSDGVVISEAAFVKGLEETVRSILLPQFQRRPHAFLALESSTAKQPDHDFNRVFRLDARLRGAYETRTIDDNHAIDDREKRKAIREAGGRGHPTCEREYYCIPTRDSDTIVIPEFDDVAHVKEVERPKHVRTYVAADPGSRDLFGLVFGYWDFGRARTVIEASWARRNASTRRVACVVALFEWRLWGRWPSRKLKDIPLKSSLDGMREGWIELLDGDGTQEECEALSRMANTEPEGRPSLEWNQPVNDNRCSYWDGRRFQQNPAVRVSDVDLRFIQDLSIEYDLRFAPTAKDDADAQRNSLRSALGGGQVLFLPTAGPVIDHVKNAVWNKHRTDYERNAVFGHFDCLAALIYLHRNIQRHHNADPPGYIGLDAQVHNISPFMRPQGTKDARGMAAAFARGNRFRPIRRIY